MNDSRDSRRSRYWRQNLRMTCGLLVVWFVVTYVAAFYARELNHYTFLGFPVGFYVGAQGAQLVYLAIIAFYAFWMDRLDRRFGLREDGN